MHGATGAYEMHCWEYIPILRVGRLDTGYAEVHRDKSNSFIGLEGFRELGERGSRCFKVVCEELMVVEEANNLLT
jgi:hypothetical protein